MLTFEDAQKIATLLSDDAFNFCTCESCIKDYCSQLSATFPEVSWDYEAKTDGSCEAVIVAKDLRIVNTPIIHQPMRIYRFRDAPEALQSLSTAGGDEDWLAIVPPYLVDEYISWMEEGTSFGCFKVWEYPHPTLRGYVVRIGCHS